MNVEIPEKPRRHRWITEAVNQGDSMVSVWPSEEDLKSDKSKEKFFETIVKVGNDPRVTKIEKAPHPDHGIVFQFYINV